MRYGLIALLVASIASSGCKNLERDRKGRDDASTADPASRTKNPKSKNWNEGPNPGVDRVDVPAADSWADPRQPGFDVDREVRGVLAGFVEDGDGHKVKDAFIEVEQAANAANGGAPVGVQTDRSGYFLIKGLKPQEAYVLTARHLREGKEVVGRAYAQTSQSRSQFVRIVLMEGLSIPGGSSANRGIDRPGMPGNSEPAPPVIPSGGTSPRTDSGTGLPLPDRNETPNEPVVPPTRPNVSRPELTTEGPAGIWRPPVTNIPTTPAPPSVVPPPIGNKSSSRSVNPNAAFTLIDTTGVPRAFPSGNDRELLLIDFMTTTCVPCKKAIPILKSLQAKYGLQGLELIGVTCDDVDIAQRRSLASAYQRNEQLNYLLYAEPGSEPGKVMKRFNVRSYPTLVLMSGSGSVLWQGHPNDVAEIERIIKDKLSR